MHGSAATGWNGGDQGLDYWIAELQALGVKWFKVLDDHGDSLNLCRKLVDAGIFPVVRIIRHDSPPNDSPEPNPGHLNATEEQTIHKLIDAGVLYFETNNEPNLGAEWKNNAMPADPAEAAKLVALNWLFDARVILDAGGYPGLPAISVGNDMDLIGALATLGRHEILLEGCWLALHNYTLNHPLDYPNDLVNQAGAPVPPPEYDYGPLTNWVWWDAKLGRSHSPDEINQIRASGKNPGSTPTKDHSGLREYEYYYALAQKYLGHPIPMLSTEGGPLIGRREDVRYPRITPQMHADVTVALYDFMQRKAPDYYFACMPWLLVPSAGWQQDAWYGDFWARAFQNGPRSKAALPPFAVPGVNLGPTLPVMNAVKTMPNVARPIAAPPMPATPVAVVIPTASTSYTVQRGDTLTSIAKKFGVSMTAIVMANNISDPSRIIAGEQLTIPTGGGAPPPPPARPAAPPPAPGSSQVAYVFQSGDTLAALAGRYDTTISAIVMANQLADPNHIAVGQRLMIPVHSAAPVAPSTNATPSGRAPGAPPAPPRISGVAQFDSRLVALGVRVSNAMVVPGLVYWKLTGATYLDAAESVGQSAIYISLVDEKGAPVDGQRVFQATDGTQIVMTTDGSGNARQTMENSYLPEQGETGNYSIWVDGLPSDRVTGLGRPHNQPVSFRLTWQKTKK